MAERFGNTWEDSQTPSEVAQDQLRALALGLDLETYQVYKRNPNAFRSPGNVYSKFFDSATGKYNIPGKTPGALMSNGGPVTGPNGEILAAGSTMGKPIDLGTLTLTKTPSELWQESHAAGNFLPPYLQSNTTQTPNGVPTPTTPPAQTPFPSKPSNPAPGVFVAPPINPAANGLPSNGTASNLPRPNAGLRGPLSLPYYLRGSRKTNAIAYG